MRGPLPVFAPGGLSVLDPQGCFSQSQVIWTSFGPVLAAVTCAENVATPPVVPTSVISCPFARTCRLASPMSPSETRNESGSDWLPKSIVAWTPYVQPAAEVVNEGLTQPPEPSPLVSATCWRTGRNVVFGLFPGCQPSGEGPAIQPRV